jgi:hypothetical protein
MGLHGVEQGYLYLYQHPSMFLITGRKWNTDKRQSLSELLQMECEKCAHLALSTKLFPFSHEVAKSMAYLTSFHEYKQLPPS